MKKLITSIFALFLTAGVAFGQVMDGDGSATNNEAIIEQTTANNQGDIIQRGTFNQARIGQGKVEHSFQNEDGGQSLYNPGTANNNKAFLRQVGSYNYGEIVQGISDGTARGTAEIPQIVELHQIGSDNEAVIMQGFRSISIGNKVDLRQNGNYNLAYVTQGRNTSGAAMYNSVEIKQNGNTNTISSNQGRNFGGSAIRNQSVIHQNGNRNTFIYQQGISGGSANGNISDVHQNGNDNDGRITQGMNDGTSIDNDANIRQIGNLNDGRIDQGVTGSSALAIRNKADIIQSGSSNKGTISQGFINGSAFDNTGLIWQPGNGNEASIRQGLYPGESAINSTATIFQNSDNNNAIIDMAGRNQSASIIQSN